MHWNKTKFDNDISCKKYRILSTLFYLYLEQFNTNIIAENVGQKYSFWSTYSLAYLTFRVEKENPFIYPLRNLYHAINIFNSAARLLLSLNCFNQMNSFMSICILSFSQMFIVRVSFNASLLRIPQQQKLT